MNIFQAFTNKEKPTEPTAIGTSSYNNSFASSVIEYKENNSKGIYDYGKKNLFPEELIRLYEHSAINQAVVNRKSLMIAGDGIETEGFDVESLAFVQKLDDDNVLRDLAMNYTMFNSMALSVVWSIDGKRLVSLEVVNSSKVRKGLNGGFYICEDWNNTNKFRPEFIEEFDNSKREGRQLIFVERESISGAKYPIPTWYSASNWINIDIEISKEYLTSLESGFSPRVMVEFMQRPAKQSDRDEIVRSLEKTYSGSAGKKIMALFSPNKELKTNINTIATDNLHEQYQVIVEHSQAQILTAHGVTSPMLMGIKSAGQLGGSTELQDSYNIFNKSVIRPDKKRLENLLNRITSINELNKIQIKDYPLL